MSQNQSNNSKRHALQTLKQQVDEDDDLLNLAGLSDQQSSRGGLSNQLSSRSSIIGAPQCSITLLGMSQEGEKSPKSAR